MSCSQIINEITWYITRQISSKVKMMDHTYENKDTKLPKSQLRKPRFAKMGAGLDSWTQTDEQFGNSRSHYIVKRLHFLAKYSIIARLHKFILKLLPFSRAQDAADPIIQFGVSKVQLVRECIWYLPFSDASGIKELCCFTVDISTILSDECISLTCLQRFTDVFTDLPVLRIKPFDVCSCGCL